MWVWVRQLFSRISCFCYETKKAGTVPCGYGHKTGQITDNTVPRDLPISVILEKTTAAEDLIDFCCGKYFLKNKPHKSYTEKPNVNKNEK